MLDFRNHFPDLALEVGVHGRILGTSENARKVGILRDDAVGAEGSWGVLVLEIIRQRFSKVSARFTPYSQSRAYFSRILCLEDAALHIGLQHLMHRSMPMPQVLI